VTATALAAAALTRALRGHSLQAAIRDVGAIALYPAVVIAASRFFSRVVVGQWFVGGDFFRAGKHGARPTRKWRSSKSAGARRR